MKDYTAAAASAFHCGTEGRRSAKICEYSHLFVRCTLYGVTIEIKETGVSLGRRIAYSPQCRQRTAILLLQLWQGCQICVKITAQLPPKASPI